VYVFHAHVAVITAEFCSFRLDLCVHAFGGKNSFLAHVVPNSVYIALKRLGYGHKQSKLPQIPLVCSDIGLADVVQS
jgi:hypothetical protein